MIEVRDVSKAFGATVALSGVSFSLEKGAFLTVLGPSGCGKTTLLRMIAGFERPSGGEIRLAGRPLAREPVHKRSIGMVFQRLALFPHMTAAQNVGYPLRMRRFDPAAIPGRVRRYLEMARLGDLGERRIHELSGGQQQRVAIARALAFEPDLLLLDEPLSSLDRKLREEMQLEFRRIQQEIGVTTINVTHDQREALVMSDRIIVMSDGVIQQNDAPSRLYQRPANRFVADFVGLSSLLAGHVVEGAEDGVSVAIGDARLGARAVDDALAPGAPVECALRAERVGLAAEAGALADRDTVVAGEVTRRIFEGDRWLCEIACAALGGALIYAYDRDEDDGDSRAEGRRVHAGWNARDLLAFERSASIH